MNRDRPLIEIRVKSIKQEPYISPQGGFARSAIIVGRSIARDASFEFQTGLLNPEQIRRCELLQRHGFTAIRVPESWPYGSRPGGWQNDAVVSAMDRIAEIYANRDEGDPMSYNEDLANEVLTVLDKTYPHPVHAHQLKHELAVEPSDAELLTALDALHLDGAIQGKPLRQNTPTGTSRLVSLANIQITAKGHKQLHGQLTAQVAPVVIHGDQNINYGHAGAMGSNSIGTINQQQQWAAIENQVDLSQVATELQALKAELSKTAKTSADFQQLALVAEAEHHAEKREGSKVMNSLSKTGKELFDVAKDIGVEVAAKLIAKSMGMEP